MSEQWKNQSDGDDDRQMPLGVGGGGNDSDADSGDSSFAEPRPKINTSTFALVASFVAALTVLYLLGLHNKPRSASAQEAAHEHQMKSAITELLQKNGKAEQIQSLFKDTDKLVQMFYHYLGSQASQSAELPGNPFASDVVYTGPATVNTQAHEIISTNAEEAETLRRIAETFNSLKLHSVLLGKTPMAMINKNLVQVGGKVGDLTVTSIESNRVVLSYGRNNYELKLAGRGP